MLIKAQTADKISSFVGYGLEYSPSDIKENDVSGTF
jgi:hypothetical protein